MTTSTAVKFILVLVTLVVVIGIFSNNTNPVVKTLLGIADGSILDDSTYKQYTLLKQENVDNIDSINALLFSINAVALMDYSMTYDEQKEFTEDERFFKDGERKFGEKTVKVIDSSLETIYPSSATNLRRAIVDAIVKCQYMFEDNGEQTTRCYKIDFKGMDKKITLKQLREEAEKYKLDYCNTGEEIDSTTYDNYCKEKIDYVFNDGIIDRLVSEVGDIDTETQIAICAKAKFELSGADAFDRIHIVSSETDPACDQKNIEKKFGLRVNDFYLKQTYGNIGNAKKFVQGYRPSILYYEMADKAITEDFEAGLYSWDWNEVVLWNTIFLVFDIIPAGKSAMKLAAKAAGREVTEEAAEQVTKELIEPWIMQFKGVKTFVERMEALSNGLTKFNEFFDKIFKGLREMPENAARSILEKYLGRETSESLLKKFGAEFFEKKIFSIIDDDLVRLAKANGAPEEAILALKQKQVEFLQKELPNMLKPGQQIDDATSEQLERLLRDKEEEFAEAMIKTLPDSQKDLLAKNMKSLAGDANLQLVEELRGFSMEGYRRYVMRNSRILGRLMHTWDKLAMTEMSEDEAKIFLKELTDERYQRLFGSLSDADKNRFFANYGTNFKLLSDDLTKDLTETQKRNIQKLMDNMDYNQRYILELERSFRKQLDEKGISANPYANKRFYLFLAAAWMVNSKMESDSEMFHAVGTNAFGYKNAISTPAVFDDTLREDWSFDDSREREETYYDFFEHFGGSSTKPEKADKDDKEDDYKTQLYKSERYTGTIPELEHYFVALTKDKFRFWWDQRPERFYLVAPCKADLDVKVTKVECYGEPLSYEKSKSKWNSFFGNEAKYETGTKNELLAGSDEYPDGIVPDFYDRSSSGEETMLYSIDENGELIKDCQTNMGAYFKEKINPFDSPYTPTTIEINPILDKRQDPNYCYAGYDFEETKMYLAFNVALPMTTSLVGGAACSAATLGTAAPICFALGGYVGSIAGGLAYEAIEAGYLGGRVHWPYHTQEISIGKQTQYAVQDAISETDAEDNTNEKETAENP